MNALMRGLIATVIVLAQPISNANAATYLFHNDHLGTPQALTDSDQQVVWQSAQDPFGEVTEVTNQVEQNLRFPGQYFDVETGLHYNYFRDYDSRIGRYVESDPIGLHGGLNTYAYVDANPLQLMDPYGLSKTDKLYGLPKKFWQWYHRNEKKNGDSDLDRNSAESLHDEWKDKGKPGPDNKRNQKGYADMGLMEWFVPWYLMPTTMGCGSLDCNENGYPDHEEAQACF